MNKNAINKIMPLRAKPSLKLEAKNDANVSATNERLARSIDFSPYNLRLEFIEFHIGKKYSIFREGCQWGN